MPDNATNSKKKAEHENQNQVFNKHTVFEKKCNLGLVNERFDP